MTLEGPHPTDAGVDGALVYAVGDIHGCYGQLAALLRRIAEDCDRRARGRRPVLILCGDYVDRGPDSDKVLQALVWLRRRADLDLHLLKGNHEQAMLAFLEEPEAGGAWLGFGGLETLQAYGVTPASPDAGPAGLARARDDLLDRLPVSHLRLLEGLELCVAVGDYAFAHAGVRPGAPLAAQSERDLLWIREGFIDAPGPFEKIVVHGHTWRSAEPDAHAHRIGIDTGAYATGVLTALRLEDGELEFLQAGDPAHPNNSGPSPVLPAAAG